MKIQRFIWGLYHFERMFGCHQKLVLLSHMKSYTKPAARVTLPTMFSSSALILRQSAWLLLVENNDISFLFIVSWAFTAQIFGCIVVHQMWRSRASDLWAPEDICLPQHKLCGDNVFFEPPKVVVPSVSCCAHAVSLSEMTSSETLL